jgi:RNA polymerase sigma-70 factor, ECF subfamily
MSARHEITGLLAQWADGERPALGELTPRVYAELRRIAGGYLKKERPDHTLQPTALVHELFLRLAKEEHPPLCESRLHFFAIAARLMRQILVDHARRRQTGKRSGRKVPIEEAISIPAERSANLLALDDGLIALERIDPRKCKVVELRYFGGLEVDEIAGALNLSTKTIRRDLAFAESWLRREMQSGG